MSTCVCCVCKCVRVNERVYVCLCFCLKNKSFKRVEGGYSGVIAFFGLL